MSIPDPTPVALYPCTVVHKRLRPFLHRFSYRVMSLYVDVEQLPALGRKLRLFSHNRWNLFSIYNRDHGARDGSSLRGWIDRHLDGAGIDLDGGPVRLLTCPRVLGYVFNPLSLWFCFHRNGELRAVLYEVNNTFGERHSYLVPIEGGARRDEVLSHEADKQLYVSPFLGMDARYAFRLTAPADRFAISIQQSNARGLQMVACQHGRRERLTDRRLLRLFLANPLLGLKVIGAIHWQALRLWRKGARLQQRPTAPSADVSVIATTPMSVH